MKFLGSILKGTGWIGKHYKLNEKKFDLLSLQSIDINKYPYLLESSSRGNKKNRYSILFFKPKVLLQKTKDDKNNFLNEFDRIWNKEKVEQDNFYFNNKKVPFCGGWFLYLGYELVEEIEPRLSIPKSPFKLPTAFASRVNTAIIFDHVDNEVLITSDDKDSFYNDIKDIEKDLSKILNQNKKSSGTIKILTKGSEFEHQEQVRRCINYIFQGEIFQANLSRLWKFQIDKRINEIEIYRELRNKNPSPFAGLINFKQSNIICSSPERLVSVNGDFLETRPIAGTRPRGSSGLQDIELSMELINSDKEKAEHLMLVDLERNDISKVCKPGSVKVNEMMTIESYAHVHHIVSNICGLKKENITPGKIIRSLFPGGTITGCPKVRCMEILGELEREGRGPYTGSLGYVTHNGNMDLNILIRSMLKENEFLYFRAGGGIVADSIPENETFETEAKANGMLKALGSLSK
ncbi:MAG: aminodeoxychorismate synthase, component I [Candidatus Pelagibacter sp.]|nr:aminodeoxychorismate synthase, component I [Candidatus Pelagibacter sp.]|tara:strand:- start:5324 stop:6715 length:1392 start_codon:yes stop_codon:yes gene_type:complete